MATTIQLKLLDNKRVETYVNGYPNAYEGGYRIIAGEQNATEFEISSVPAQYKNATFSLTLKNSMKEEVEAPEIVNNKFTLPVGMAVAGYGSIVITAKLDDEVIVWTPLKIKVWNTDPNWQNYVIVSTPIQIGETETLPAGSEAYVKNVGTALKPILNVGIPQGENGENGIIPEISVNATVDNNTGMPLVDVEKSGNNEHQSFTLNFKNLKGKSFDENGYYKSVHVGKADKDGNGNSLTSFYAHDIKFTLDNTNFVITAVAVNANGEEIGEPKKIDLPLESVVVNAKLDDSGENIILILQNGNTVSFSINKVIEGLATTEQLSAEIALREAADNNIQNSINNEIEARKTADNNLQANIENESNIRENAYNDLQQQIEAIESGKIITKIQFPTNKTAQWYTFAKIESESGQYVNTSLIISGAFTTNRQTIPTQFKNYSGYMYNNSYGILNINCVYGAQNSDGWLLINIKISSGNIPEKFLGYYIGNNNDIYLCVYTYSPNISTSLLKNGGSMQPIYIAPSVVSDISSIRYIGNDLPFVSVDQQFLFSRSVFANNSGFTNPYGAMYYVDVNNIDFGGALPKIGDYLIDETGHIVICLENKSADDVPETYVYDTGKFIPFYVRPKTGITRYDLAQDVQDAISKANTALQTAPVTSVNGLTGNVNLTPSVIGAATKNDIDSAISSAITNVLNTSI